jgi:hypothetical protein
MKEAVDPNLRGTACKRIHNAILAFDGSIDNCIGSHIEMPTLGK